MRIASIVLAGAITYLPALAQSKSAPLLCKDHPSFRSATAVYSLSEKALKAGRLKEADHLADVGWQTIHPTITSLDLASRAGILDDGPSAYQDVIQEQRKGHPDDWVRDKLNILGEALKEYGSVSCAGPPAPPRKPPSFTGHQR